MVVKGKDHFGIEGYEIPKYDGKLKELYGGPNKNSNLPKSKLNHFLHDLLKQKSTIPAPNAYTFGKQSSDDK